MIMDAYHIVVYAKIKTSKGDIIINFLKKYLNLYGLQY